MRVVLFVFVSLFSLHSIAQNLSFSPSMAGRGDQVQFTIKSDSNNFSDNIGEVYVTFYSYVNNSNTSFNSDTAYINGDSTIRGTVTIPRYIPDGPCDVNIVLNAPYQFFELKNMFTVSGGVMKPVISGMTPSQAGRGDSILYTITTTGTSFTLLNPENIYVSLIDPKTQVDIVSSVPHIITNDSQLQGGIKIPRYLKDGAVGILISSPQDGAMTDTLLFSIAGGLNIPVLETLSQDTAARGDSITLLMHFRHTLFETTFIQQPVVYFYDSLGHFFSPYNIELIDDTTLRAKVAVPRYYADGAFNVLVHGWEEGDMQLPAGFSILGGVPVPGILSFVPSQTQIERGTYVDFTLHTSGTRLDLVADQGFVQVTFGKAFYQWQPVFFEIVDSVTITGQLVITKAMPDHFMMDVTLQTSLDGKMILENVIEVNGGKLNPKLVLVTPPVLNRGQVVDLFVTGVNTDFDKDLFYYLDAGGINIIEYEVIDSNTLRVKVEVSSGTPGGFYHFAVNTNIDGYMELFNAFWVNPMNNDKAIVSITPSVLVKGSTVDLTITTENMQLLQGFDTVYFHSTSGISPITLNTMEVLSNTEIRCNVSVSGISQDTFCGVAVYNSIDGWVYRNAGLMMTNTSLKEYPDAGRVSIYPNPSSGNLYCKSGSSDPAKVVAIDIMGKMVFQGWTVPKPDGSMLVLDRAASGLKPGMYLITVSQNGETLNSRILLE